MYVLIQNAESEAPEMYICTKSPACGIAGCIIWPIGEYVMNARILNPIKSAMVQVIASYVRIMGENMLIEIAEITAIVPIMLMLAYSVLYVASAIPPVNPSRIMRTAEPTTMVS